MRSFPKLLLVIVTLVSSVLAGAGEPQEGKDYAVIAAAKPAESSKIVVTEFFSYQCPHCFAFFKPLHEWSLRVPADVQFERKAVSIGHRPWVDIGRTFYALEHMRKLAALDEEIFNAIHQKGTRMDNIGLIMGWLNQKSIPLMEFDAAYRSPLVRGKFDAGEALTEEYRIPGVPTMVVDGKYMVAIASNVPFDQQLAVVDHLIARARAQRKK